VVGGVLVLVVAAVCVRLGIWQLDRLDQRQAENARVREGMQADVVALDALVPPGGTPRPSLEYRRVSVRGRYDPRREVLVTARSLNGRPGQHVVTPLVTGGGTAVLVNRGFVQVVDPEAPVPERAAPPSGQVEVVGLLRPSERRERFGPQDAAEGTLRSVARVDVERLAAQMPYDVSPMFVQLQEQRPPQGEIPVALPPPDLGEGPHLNYAVQWFLFATVFLVGYPVLVRRRASPVRPSGVARDARPTV
jgi:cytochrome oxidase assembly protein ShyY1